MTSAHSFATGNGADEAEERGWSGPAEARTLQIAQGKWRAQEDSEPPNLGLRRSLLYPVEL